MPDEGAAGGRGAMARGLPAGVGDREGVAVEADFFAIATGGSVACVKSARTEPMKTADSIRIGRCF